MMTDAQAAMMDGLALMFWLAVAILIAIVAAMVLDWRRGRSQRAQRGEWEHMSRVSSLRDRARQDARHVLGKSGVDGR